MDIPNISQRNNKVIIIFTSMIEILRSHGIFSAKYILKLLTDDPNLNISDDNYLKYVFNDSYSHVSQKYEIFMIIYRRRKRRRSKLKIINKYIMNLDIIIDINDIVLFINECDIKNINLSIFDNVTGNYRDKYINIFDNYYSQPECMNYAQDRQMLEICINICDKLNMEHIDFQKNICENLCKNIGSIHSFNSVYPKKTSEIILPKILEETLMNNFRPADFKFYGYIRWIKPVGNYVKFVGEINKRGKYIA